MTTIEKFDAILERLKDVGKNFTPTHLSYMVLMSYLDELQALNMVDGGYTLSTRGKDAAMICTEFDWIPTNKDIGSFVDDVVAESDREGFKYFLIEYRDNREKILEDIKNIKKEQG